MHISKKLLAFSLAIALAIAVVACNVENGKNDGKYVIGISQLMVHDALDAGTKGFQDAVIEKLGKDNVEFDTRYAGGSSELCASIASDFVNAHVDLILANATPALQAACEATTKIPILGTSITEYGVVLGADNFNEGDVSNVSGTTDLAPLPEQAQMILDIVPNVKTVGIIYCSEESNSEYQVKIVKEYLESKDVAVTEYPFSDSDEITAVTKKAALECDALYVPTDNRAAKKAESIYEAMADNLKPLIAGEEALCKGCGIATLTANYYDLGYATGLMAVKILTGEEKIENMKIEYATEFTKKYNAKICEELGIDTEALEAAGYVAIQ